MSLSRHQLCLREAKLYPYAKSDTRHSHSHWTLRQPGYQNINCNTERGDCALPSNVQYGTPGRPRASQNPKRLKASLKVDHVMH
eukprot:4476068-Pleurochrysis_carterae.AAC.1